MALFLKSSPSRSPYECIAFSTDCCDCVPIDRRHVERYLKGYLASPPQGEPQLFTEPGEYLMLILVCSLFIMLGAFALILAFR
jgi:hypothetical protein